MSLTKYIVGLPRFVGNGRFPRAVPQALATPIVRDRVLIVPDTTAVMIREPGVAGSPSDLHDAARHKVDLVIPTPSRHLK